MKELLKKFLQDLGLFTDHENHTEPEQEVEEGEKVIGEMNDLEKGCFTFLSEKSKEHEEISEKGLELLLCSDEEEVKKQMEELKYRHQKIHKAMNVARSIMWASIEDRFSTSEGSTCTGVRKGFKIVEIFEDETHSISGMVIPGLGMMISMGR